MNKLKEGQRIGVYEVLSSGGFFNIMKNDNFIGKKENGLVYLYDEKEPTHILCVLTKSAKSQP